MSDTLKAGDKARINKPDDPWFGTVVILLERQAGYWFVEIENHPNHSSSLFLPEYLVKVSS